MTQNMFGDYYNAFEYGWSPVKAAGKNRRFRPEVGVAAAEAEGGLREIMEKKIRMGAMNIELQLGSQQRLASGAESYGKEARHDLKRLSEVNEVDIHSVHAPSHLQGLSGFDARNNQFDDQQAASTSEEIKVVVDFAADVTHGGSIVVHTGEFPRAISDADNQFEDYEGSDYGKMIYFADKDTGQIAGIPRTREFSVFKRDDEGELVVEEDKVQLDKKSYYQLKDDQNRIGDQKFREIYGISNDYAGDLAEKALINLYFQPKIEEMQAEIDRHDSMLQSAKSELDDLNARTPEEVRAELERQFAEHNRPAHGEAFEEAYNKQINRLERAKEDANRQVLGQAKTIARYEREKGDQTEQMKRFVSIQEVGLTRTADNLAKLGIYALNKTREKNLERPLTLTPENVFPNLYGGHVDEVIKIVEQSREQFVKRLTTPGMIDDPSGKRNVKTGEIRKIKNPYFDPHISEKKAKKLAEEHIKSTFDFQHLGMWKKHFKINKAALTKKQKKMLAKGKEEEVRKQQFDDWYRKQIDTLAGKKGFLGNLHVVDGFGRGHVHLPAGQGEHIVSEAVMKLREKGFDIPMTSEGWYEGPERQLLETWSATDRVIYQSDEGPVYWHQMQNAYVGAGRPADYLWGQKMLTDQEEMAPGSGVLID